MRSFMGKNIIQDTYDQDQKNFILEFLDLEECLALLTEQVLDQMR